MMPALPFPAVVRLPDGRIFGPGKLAVTDGGLLRLFTVSGGKVVLALEVAADVSAPTRQSREWGIVLADGSGSVWVRRQGCACGQRRLLVGFDPDTWTGEA